MSVYLRQGEDKSENGFTSVALLNTSLQRERHTLTQVRFLSTAPLWLSPSTVKFNRYYALSGLRLRPGDDSNLMQSLTELK